MEKTKSVQSLKRQLTAAIAMVLVAAIALISATYAWFVANNTVTANTASISAQSNSPYLVISNSDITKDTTTDTVTTEVENKTLFPVQMIAATESNPTFTWESAYASAAAASTEKANTRFVVQEADKEKYYLKQTFHVGTNGTTQGQFKNLRVASVSVTAGSKPNSTDTATDNQLTNAIRIMVVCDNEVAIYDKDGNLVTTYNASTTTTADNKTISGLTEAEKRSANGVETEAVYLTTADTAFPTTAGEIGDKTVDVYLYYDGAETVVNTNNLDKLGAVKATVTFKADDFAAPTTRTSTGG